MSAVGHGSSSEVIACADLPPEHDVGPGGFFVWRELRRSNGRRVL